MTENDSPTREASENRPRRGFTVLNPDADDLANEEKIRETSWKFTHSAGTISWIGLILIVGCVVLSVASQSAFGLIGPGAFGLSLLVLSTVVRPLDRILAQLIQINEKLDRDR